jgi:hypothetical protein
MLPSKILIAMLACFLLASSVQEARADNAAKEAIQGAAQAQKDEAIQAAQAKVEDKVQALNAGMPMIGLGSVAMGASMVLLF